MVVLSGEALGAFVLPAQLAVTAAPWLIGIGLLGVISLFFALILLSRRRERRELREIVVAIEELRSGAARRRLVVDPRSPLAFVADAVNRLGQDLSARRTDLESSDERLRAILDGAREYAVVVTDTDGDIRSFSSGATALFGWEEEEIVARPATVLFEEDSWKSLLPKLTRRSFRERGVESPAVLVRRDGTHFQGQLSVRQLIGRDGTPSGFLLLIKDVTAEVRLEGELKESEARYRSLLEGLDEGVFLLQDGHQIVFANPALGRLCGVPVGDLVGTRLHDRVATRDLLLVRERLAALGEGPGTQDEMRFTLLGAGGERLADVRLRATAIVHQGKSAVLGVLLDETAERLAEQELRQNEARLDAVLESTSDGILVVADTPTGSVVRMTNDAFLKLFDLRASEVLGASEVDLLRFLRGRGEGAEAIAAFLASATTGPRTEAVVLGSVPPRVLELRACPLVSTSGQLLGRVLACRDVSDREAIERRLETNADELRRGKASLEQAYARLAAVKEDLERRTQEQERLNRELRTLDDMKSSLLANVSHELQTPLVSIRGYTEMILKERLGSITEEQRKGLTLSLKNIDRLIAMIDNLLAFARMDREAASLNLSTFPLKPLIEEVMDLLRERARERQITMSLAFEEEGTVDVEADRDKILQVFLNLISNAIKFNRETGRIEVIVRPGKPGYAQVQVKDTGVGIPKDDLERVFDRYYQVRGQGTPAQGSGIGLALVRNILRLHGCAIQAESQEGRGSTFSFSLPLAGEQGRQEGRKEGGSPPAIGYSNAAAGSQPSASARAPSTPASPPRTRFRIIRNKKPGEE